MGRTELLKPFLYSKKYKCLKNSLFIGHFPLPEDAWWEEYYCPLEERIRKLRKKYKKDPKALSLIEKEQQEIDLYRKYSKWYGSVFFIMQKK